MLFPHPCGDQFEYAVTNGADPNAVVPDNYVVVKGGTLPLPAAGEVFSGATGPTLTDAAAAVPHGQIRITTAGDIRAAGGTVTWLPEKSRHHTVNRQHVNITEGTSTFSELTRNPVRLRDRIDGDKP